MKHYKQFQPLVISEFETAKWMHPEHNHNHYELIFIQHGKGMHNINGNQIDYTKGDIFLVGPDEEHYFEIGTITQFIFIKFTDLYIHQLNSGSTYGLQELEYLIKSRETHFSGFNLSQVDRQTAQAIIYVILSLKQDIFLNERLIWLQLLALAALLQRNMPELKTALNRTRDMQAVFCYLHKYVYTPSKLRAPVIAAHFNTTADYIGPYFKRNTGMTLRDYISAYRKTLIKQRIESGNYNLKNIANEFGLTDESHVRKILLS
ncbi:AraC family transcriptional regulator [Mucilaginibacter sp. X5P1]|uniref:AraC family transcriptional regulator n=1 Tax=Mucilaginibacter sp. X5P1 TaxID=2723088 RepID=UPI0016159C8C|nr:AraC family ligand binding domain-containing protein [Mucilaginibacter sp. X5P1]MBB6140316.1 AraC-like DNA-binding protein [Mucilaginibacter sp. X5P1]